MIGKTLHNYRLVRELGRGGMGVVYRAQHDLDGSFAAVKVLPERFASSSVLVERFKREAGSLRNLVHSNIVRFFHLGVQDDTYFIVMELVEGSSLRKFLDKKKPLAVGKALDIAIQCCDALSYAHGKGIIHRDIKPGNILIDKEGKVKVSDFGLARIVGDEALSVGDLGTAIGEGSIGLIATKGSRLTRTGTSPGTVDYMSPEQREPGGETDQRTDIYSLGVVLYEMLTGRLPVAMMEMPSKLNPSATEGLDRIVATALAPRKEKRYQEIGELKRGVEEELSRKQHGLESENRKREERERSRRGEQRRKDEERKKREERRRREEERLRQAEERKEAKVVRAKKPGRGSNGWRLRTAATIVAIIVIGITGYSVLQSVSGARRVEKPRKPAVKRGVTRVPRKLSSKPSVGVSKEITNSVGMKLVLIPAGEFMMGSPLSEGGRGSDEGPQHRVKITKPFYIGKYEVTQAEYEAVMGKNRSHFRGADNPVENVSWNDAVEFCKRLSEKEGVTYRLPTEAEWEYACRAGTSTAYCFGDSEGGLGEYGWYWSNSGKKTHPVGEKKPNALGLYDMHGNVWEWCVDWYDKEYYKNSPTNNPEGLGSGECRVLRGGGWYFDAYGCRSAYRSWISPSYSSNYSGFRCVCSGAL